MSHYQCYLIVRPLALGFFFRPEQNEPELSACSVPASVDGNRGGPALSTCCKPASEGGNSEGPMTPLTTELLDGVISGSCELLSEGMATTETELPGSCEVELADLNKIFFFPLQIMLQ